MKLAKDVEILFLIGEKCNFAYREIFLLSAEEFRIEEMGRHGASNIDEYRFALYFTNMKYTTRSCFARICGTRVYRRIPKKYVV